MKKKITLNSTLLATRIALGILAIIFFAIIVGTQEPTINNYARGITKAKISDYRGIKEITDFKQQIEVSKSYVKIGLSKVVHEPFLYSVDPETDDYFLAPRHQIEIYYFYYDMPNKNPHVWFYMIDIFNGDKIGIYSNHPQPRKQSDCKIHKYADKNLQEIIDNDCKILREKGGLNEKRETNNSAVR